MFCVTWLILARNKQLDETYIGLTAAGGSVIGGIRSRILGGMAARTGKGPIVILGGSGYATISHECEICVFSELGIPLQTVPRIFFDLVARRNAVHTMINSKTMQHTPKLTHQSLCEFAPRGDVAQRRW